LLTPLLIPFCLFFFVSSRRRHTRSKRDWSSDVCSSDLIGSAEKVQAVVDKAKEFGVPIRVGVNSGSLEKNLIEKYGKVTAEGLEIGRASCRERVWDAESRGYME